MLNLNTYGQTTYPVQVYTQLTPPYTSYLPAYYSGVNQKLKVTLINTDMAQSELSVYLRMRIQSSSFTIETPENVYTERISLQAGVPLQLSLNDLATYFKNENMRISGGRNEFLRTNTLPDNFYRFNFEVYEATTGRLLSNPKLGFVQAMIASGEPPILNMPLKGSTIMEANIPSIMFSWTPRHMNSMASAYGTEYEFTLVEIFDKQVAPEAAFDYSRVLYTETVRSTSFVHTVAQPMLVPSMRYAWRVRAVAREGIEEANVFKNNGYSPISWFDYTVDCKLVQYDKVEVKDRVATISWQKTDAIDYDVQYRKKGSNKWYEGSLKDHETCPVYNLKFGEEYEYKIGVRCTMNDPFAYTDVKGFRMPEELAKNSNCGILPNINVSNQTPTRELQTKLPILVGDFPVFVTKVSGSGKFTGEGYVGIPYLKNAKIAVTFKDITVNTDNRMITGFIETKYDVSASGNNLLWDVDETLTGGKGVGDIRTGEEKAQYIVDYTISSSLTKVPIRKDTSEDNIEGGETAETTSGENERYIITLTDESGGEHEQVVEKFPTTIEDKSGATYNVDKEGNIKQVSSKSDVKLDDKTKYVQDKVATIQFESIDGVTKYALDAYNDVYKEVAEFEREYIVEEGNPVRASIKFMEANSSDDIFVRLVNSEESFDPAKVHFVTDNQKEYKATYNAEERGWRLTLVGSDANDGLEVFAVYKKGNSEYSTLAVLKVVSYEPKSVNIALVPVNEAKGNFTDIAKVKDELNKVYNKVGITVNVSLTDNFDYTLDSFDVTGSGLFSTRTNDMKAIESAFMATAQYKENTAYLFIMDISPEVDDNSVALGDMPRKSQFGYLFKGASANTVAHEIGHGLFHLDHPFARANAANSFNKESLTDNLMHYHGGHNLAKLQWDAIHAPGLVIGMFEKDGDGMSAIVTQNSMEKIKKFQNKDGSYTFVTPAGKPITIWESLSEIIFNTYEDKYTDGTYNQVLGSLIGFKLNSGEEYRATKIASTRNFTGYLQINSDENSSSYYIDNLTAKNDYEHVLIGIPSIANHEVIFNVVPIKKKSGYTSFIDVTVENRGDGVVKEPFFLEQELNSYFTPSRTEGVDYIELYAQQNLSDEQRLFLSSLSKDINGSEALYVYAIADLMDANNLSLGCLADASSWDNFKKTKLAEYIISQYGISENAPLPGYNPNLAKWKDTYEILLKWANLSKTIYAKDIDKQALSSLVGLLDNFDSEDGRACFLRSLTIDTRKTLLKKSGEWTISSSKEKLLVDIIATTPTVDIAEILSFLEDDKFGVYWKLYDEINATEAERYIAIVSQLILSQNQRPESADAKISVNKQLYIGTPIIKINPILFAERQSNGNLIFYPTEGKLYGDGYIIDLSKTNEVSLFDFVEVTILEDFRYENIQSTDTYDTRLKEGDKLVVPALWIYGIVDRQTTISNFAAVRVIADICAVAAAVTTRQPGVFIVVDGVFAGLDITVALSEDKIMSSGSEGMQELIHTWDNIAVVWGTTVLTKTAGYMVINREGLVTYFSNSIKGNAVRVNDFFEQLDLLIKEIRLNTASQSSLVSYINDIKLTLQLQSKLSRLGQATLEADHAQYQLSQGQRIAARINGRDHYIGRAIADESSNFTGIDDIQWYNSTTHGDVSESLHVINDVEYTPQGQSAKAKGDLETVRASNGSVYVRVADDIDNFSNLFVGARQRAIAKFGKEAEDIIYIKFNKDRGAAAEIIDHFGKDGLDALKQVNMIQDAAINLTKDRILYRYLNETSYQFNEIKKSGVIIEAPKEFPIYVTTEKYLSGSLAKQKLQLPGSNEPTWVAEFEGNLIQTDIKFPMAKWNQQDYIEVTCKSFPKQGTGGGVQFITNSSFKLRKMTNLKTGEVINF